MDEKQRYEIFKIRQGKCAYCGTRLKWESYRVRGLAGSWELDGSGDECRAYCYKCYEFPNRGKTAHNLTINEEQRSTAEAMGVKDAEKEDVEKAE